MAVIDKVERPEFSLTGDEAEILWSMLDYYRNTLLRELGTAAQRASGSSPCT